MGVPSLSTRDIEHARADGQLENFDQPRDFAAGSLRGKKRAVLQEIVGVEGGLPPLFSSGQKKTGSRYAPKTDSMAARISYSVQ